MTVFFRVLAVIGIINFTVNAVAVAHGYFDKTNQVFMCVAGIIWASVSLLQTFRRQR